jgi:hypothetical protein
VAAEHIALHDFINNGDDDWHPGCGLAETPEFDRLIELEGFIADTPARTPAGWAAQAEIGLIYCSASGPADGPAAEREPLEARALRNLYASLKQLAGAVVVA